MDVLPLKVKDLITELDKEFPLEMPNIKLPDREVWFKAGQRDIVNYLIKLQKES